MNNTIPIILASDNNYAPYMSVLMISILKNSQSDSFFDFYLLVPDSFDEENKNKIKKDCDFYEKKQINFINMKNAFSNTKQMIPHITEHTYYRLMAADILPENYDKCIYLDIDTIVNSDISEFYNIDLEDNYVAGVKAPGYHFPEDGNIGYCQKIGLISISQYINAGVILLNLKKIRETNITPVLCEEALMNYPCQDQDVINKVFYDKIKHLQFKYNAMTTRLFEKDEKLLKIFNELEIKDARKTPFIIHYADKIKPWHKRTCIFADYWWKYAKESCFYKLILQKSLIDKMWLFLPKIFNCTKVGEYKIITILGIKIKIKKKVNNILADNREIQLKDLQKNVYFNLFAQNNGYLKTFSDNNFNNFISFQYDYYTTPKQAGVNLGDYVQSIATLNVINKLYPDNNIISFDRDNLGNYCGVPAYTIMQGWFSNSYTFLPNNNIVPIYVGMHVCNRAQKSIFEFLQYNPNYFSNEIIGCRDKATQQFFDKLGVPNYFSRCLTLTLPKRSILPTQNKIFLVNLPSDIINYIPKNIRCNAEIINQRIIDVNKDDMYYYNSGVKYMQMTKDLLNKYKTEAKLVITSALHCASPCIAMGIPVILLENSMNQNRLSALDGIIKKYSYCDFSSKNIDYEPFAPNIENLKQAMINNIELSIKLKQGESIDIETLSEVRKYISDYNLL